MKNYLSYFDFMQGPDAIWIIGFVFLIWLIFFRKGKEV